MSEPTTTMRDALEAAFEKADEPLPTAAASDPAPALDPIEPAETSSEPVAATSASQDLNALAEEKPVDNEALQQQERDEQGKFKNPKVCRLDQSQARVSRVKERQHPGVLTSASTGAHYPSLCVLRSRDARQRSLALSRKPPRHARPPRL